MAKIIEIGQLLLKLSLVVG